MLARLATAGRHPARRGAASVARAIAFTPPAQWQTAHQRSFLTSRVVTNYVMKRAKILQIVWRALAAYPEMHYITEPDAPINKFFSRDSSARERAFMFVLSLLPPDEAVDLPEFLRGAEDAAKLVLEAVYDPQASQLELLETLATPECVALWKQKREQVCRLLGVDEEATLRLESVKVKHVGASEIKYSFWNAKYGASDKREATEEDLEPPTGAMAGAKTEEAKKEDSSTVEPRPHSKFLTHEAMQLKVKFNVREHLTVEEADKVRSVVVSSTFEWAFDSDVSRAELLDWVVTSSSPFSSKVTEKDDSEDDIVSAIEDAA